jgi:predicted AlkP superfamily phosphohydrolase/phosphomutase
MAVTERLLIIGLDGATFDLIGPWAKAGKLPNLSRLMETGAFQPLRSTIPPMTFPSWTTFMTGQNVGKHGVFDFTERKPNSYEVQFVNGSARKAKTMWKIMSDAGKRVCVVGLPCTYPPDPVNGVMISGFDAPNPGPKSMYPSALYEELRERVGEYIISPDIVKHIDANRPDQALASILRSIDRKAATALYLFQREPWDCMMAMFGESDSSAHHFWKFHDHSSPHYEAAGFGEDGDPLLSVYQRLDEAVGDLLAAVPPGTTTMVVSDHGHGGTGDKIMYVNRWLAQEGFLAFRRRGLRDLTSGVRYGLTRLGGRAKMILMRVLPRRVRKLLAYERRGGLVNKIESFLRFASIDWSGTRAFSEETPYYPTIWINVRGRDPEGTVEPGPMYDAVRREIIERLLAWKDPETGEPVVKAVHRREDVYHGPELDRIPDLLVSWNLDRGYSYLSRPSYQAQSGQSVERMSRAMIRKSRFMLGRSGSHRDHGILILSGQGIVQGIPIREPGMLDLAPTVLHLLGVPVPELIDGRVLSEALDARTVAQVATTGSGGVAVPAAAQAEEGDRAGARYSEEENEKIEDRLRDLGYID